MGEKARNLIFRVGNLCADRGLLTRDYEWYVWHANRWWMRPLARACNVAGDLPTRQLASAPLAHPFPPKPIPVRPDGNA